MGSDVSFVCVGTPSLRNGKLDLSHIEHVSREIGTALQQKTTFYTIVLRSTVLPGTTETLMVPTIESASGKRAGVDFAVCYNPEFMREGSAVADFLKPPYTILGSQNPQHLDSLRALYKDIPATVFETSIRVAEMVKYVSNLYHAVKVGFANEVGSICKSLAVDSHEVMRLLCEDTKLNISPRYLRPGFAFGGSCLPKDVRALVYRARERDVETPLLDGLLASNRRQIERAFQMIQHVRVRRVAILGLAFKSGTDDLRESPMVTLVEMLVGRGYQLRIYDRDVHEANITGANREYIEQEIPHLWTLMTPDLGVALADAEVIVVGNGSPEFADLPSRLKPGQHVVDLVRMKQSKWDGVANYDGFSW
jgi:GDP-mannose 6-dehydrogenase